MKFITQSIVVWLLPGIMGVSAAQTGDPGTKKISVITYNVQFLPGIAAVNNERKEPDYRATRIAQEVSRYDIVALQEVFEERHRVQVIEGIQRIWNGEGNVLVSPTVEGRYTHGGCVLMTRLPMIETHTMVFENFSSPEEYGVRADGHAAKGVIHARIGLDEADTRNFIDVFVTHLEARADHLRPLQYVEMAAFIKERSDPSRPMLLLGDLNTRGMIEYRNDPESQYSVLMKTLGDTRPGGSVEDVWPALMGEALGGTSEQESAEIGKRIDYVIAANPDSPGRRLNPVSIRVELYQDERVFALSDHNAVIAEFEWPAAE